MDKKKLIIGGLVIVAGFVLYKKLYKKDDVKIEEKATVTKWEDLDKETVKKKAKEIRVGVNKTINANINPINSSCNELFSDFIKFITISCDY